MTKPELGTKRLCAGCNAKFYDLNKPSIVCPMCEAVFVLPKPAPARPMRRAFEPMPGPVPVVVPFMAPVAAALDSEDEKAETADGDDKDADSSPLLLEEIDED